MLRWIVLLSLLCLGSAALGLGHLVPLARSMQSMMLALTALSATLLICSFDAYETQTQPSRERDDEA